MDFYKEENTDGVRFTFNTFPMTKLDLTRVVLPLSFHYTPLKKTENLQLLEYDPITCTKCKSVLNPFCTIDFRSKSWECPFCLAKILFPSSYANFLTETNLPAELIKDFTTVEYKLNTKEANYPTFIFLIDTAVEAEELDELKDAIQTTLSTLNSECYIGLITFGAMCQVHEIGFGDFPKMHVFRGDKAYKSLEIQDQLGLIKDNKNTVNQNKKKYILPLKDCEFAINSFLDELRPDYWPSNKGERHSRCSGLAMDVAISILESTSFGDPSRVILFSGGAPSVGPGQIIGKPLQETIRNYVDFEKGNDNTKYFKPAVEFYELLANRAYKAGIILDVYSCSLNQVGLLEMKCCVEKTGGMIVLTDSFSTMLFKDSFKKLFELDEYGNFINMYFKGKLDIFTTYPLRLLGGMGYLVSLNQAGTNVSDQKFGQSGTNSWNLGGMDNNSTYTFLMDVNNSEINNQLKRGLIQIVTTYVHSDRSIRKRITTVGRKFCNDVTTNVLEMSQGFDQEAAAVLMARYCVYKGYTEERIEVLRWLDKQLIRLITKFGDYKKDNVSSFRLPMEFNYFPQFMFYLRRSHFIQNFNASPDEATFYKTTILHENVTNSTVMIQPLLFAYTPDKPEATAVFLDIENMKNENVLLLDAFFFICVWHGEAVCKWRDDGYQNNPEYENIKNMLESPQEYAQQLISERLPVPRFVSCDSGSGQERLVKCTVNPSTNTGSNTKVMQEGFTSDDVTLKVFMDSLIKLAVQS